MMENTDISRIRRDYSLTGLDEKTVDPNPFEQFSKWMEEAINANVIDPSAMILATADKNATPSVRVVLLKGIDDDGFIFYTNYDSKKGRELIANPNASLLFFWKEFERQVRIYGKVEKVNTKQSEEYFSPDTAQPGDRNHRPLGIRQILTGLRHAVCGRTMALRRVAFDLRTDVPR